MKLNALDDLLSKWQNISDPVLIMHYGKQRFFFTFALPLLYWWIKTKTQNFNFYKASFHLKEMRCNQSNCRHLGFFFQKTKTRVNSYV